MQVKLFNYLINLFNNLRVTLIVTNVEQTIFHIPWIHQICVFGNDVFDFIFFVEWRIDK